MDLAAHPGDDLTSLSALERDVATVLALLGKMSSYATWVDALKSCGMRGAGGRKIRGDAMAACCERLVQAGLVVANGSYGTFYAVDPNAALRLLADAHARGTLERLELSLLERDRTYLHETHPMHRTTRARVALARGDLPGFIERYAQGKRSWSTHSECGRWLLAVMGTQGPLRWIDALDDEGRGAYAAELLRHAIETLEPLREAFLPYVRETRGLEAPLARVLVLTGRGREALEVPGLKPRDMTGIAFLEAFWRGDHDEAERHAANAIAAMKGLKHKQLRDLEGACHALHRVGAAGRGVPGAWDELATVIEGTLKIKVGYDAVYHLLTALGHSVTTSEPRPIPTVEGRGWMATLVAGLVHVWLERKPPAHLLAAHDRWLQHLRKTGAYPPLLREVEALDVVVRGGAPTPGTLTALYRPRASWELALDGLESVAQATEPDVHAPPEARERLAWELCVKPPLSVMPRLLQSARARRGKAVSVLGLFDTAAPWLTEHDRAVLAAVDPEEVQRARRGRYALIPGCEVLPALVGHPNVIAPDGTPLRVVTGRAELVATPCDDGTRLSVSPPALAQASIACERHGAEVVVYTRPPEIERLVASFVDGALVVPKAGEARLARVLTALAAKVPVRGHGHMEIRSRAVEPARAFVAQLRWDTKALHVALRAAPLGTSGPVFVPGEGEADVAGEVCGELLRTTRDLDAERERLEAILDACPSVENALLSDGATAAAFGLQGAYELLVELAALGDALVLTWPRGKGLALPVRRDVEHLQIRVGQGTSWLGVSASLQVDEREVLLLAELLKRRGEGGRFIRLDDERVLALTEALAQKLDALQRLGKPRKNELRVHAAVLPFVAELAEGVGSVALDDRAQSALARVREAERYDPKVPRGLQAQLRPYQHEGFVWLGRLARAGLGACLADDMGLGKTIQALALLVLRARGGPALVVVPTTVVGNWRDEATRFAPTLRIHELATSDRAALIASAGPRDVIVCTYGLLVSEAEALAKKSFHTVVFDEAHALKNAGTARARAAFALQADFRLGLTGTPIENHLGELWSVMQAAVPGLLGEASHFEQSIAAAIARGDRRAAAHLRALVRPFILRRTKEQVLGELPERTETVLRVKPRPDEAAYYEALRRRALQKVAKQGRRPGGKTRLQLLTEITRLRQAAVDPRLLDDEAAPAGSKIDAAVEQIEALREEGHRVLVFTQFLGSMALLRERLEVAGIAYLELDGSTPAKERAARVDAFQAGEGDVFLMSLRAGGIGVNLTGADYVIHLDPWWNPAVEDQATGRVHRIGQTRPVTVYRFVTTGTIEERILDLHERKRELAEDLLEGMETSRKLSLDELRALLSG